MSSSIDLNSDSRAGQGGAWIGLGESRFPPRYASFLRTVPRGGVIREGRVNPMQLAGLDGPLAPLISPCTDPARLDASQDRRFCRQLSRPARGCNSCVALRSLN